MNSRDFLKPSPFTLIGLLFALATLILFFLAIFWSSSFGVPCIFTLLLGGLFLLIGGNDQVSASE
ncbi:MAG TPA: hypothetical protein VH186_05225 [Chloroflexia bacterium]|nr:hypothetical protein [Chloroflexia bacterium]